MVLSLVERGVIYMTRWKLKSCPRCGGDMFINSDLYGWYEKCLQCSYQHDLKDLVEFKKQAARGEMEPARVGKSRPKK
jgi:hypothetical protein